MSNTRRLRPMHFTLVWFNSKDLDDLIICQLLPVFKAIFAVNNLDQGLELLRLIYNENVILIVPNELLEPIGPSIQPMSHVDSVYIYSEEQINLEQWKLADSKLKGPFNNLLSQCRLLQRMSHACHLAPISSNVLSTNAEFLHRTSNQLDPTYMWTQLLKEIILEIDNGSEALEKMFNYFRQKFANDHVMLNTIIKAEKEYSSKTPIAWYTEKVFFYNTLNTALRLQDVETILQFGPYLRDLHEHIKQLHAIKYPASSFEPFMVYRGQSMHKAEFDKLKINSGGLYSFNNFLSTSLALDTASTIADSIAMSNDQNLIAIQFVINIKHSQSDVPFANVSEISNHKDEEEILFSMHTIFRVTDVKPLDNNDRMWRVELESTSDNDDKLQKLTEEFRLQLDDLTSQHRIASILVSLSYYNQALKIYEELLHSTNDQEKQAFLHFKIGAIKSCTDQYREAIKEFKQAVSIYEDTTRNGKEGRFFTSHHAAKTYSALGLAHGELAEYNTALYFLYKALEIDQLDLEHYFTLASLIRKEGLFPLALQVCETMLKTFTRTTRENHPTWIQIYDLTGHVHMDLGQNKEALDLFSKSLKIAERWYPSNHPFFPTCYKKMADVCANMGKYGGAKEYYQVALEMYKQLPLDEKSLSNFYTELVGFYTRCQQYETALDYYRKSLAIKKENLPVDHIDFAIMDLILAMLYNHWKKYEKALPLFLTAFAKLRDSPSADRSYLAECCAHMGQMWHELGNAHGALCFYKNALEIRQATPLSSYRELTTLCASIAAVYHKRNDYGEALAYYERAKTVSQSVLPDLDPTVQELNKHIEHIEILMHTNFDRE